MKILDADVAVEENEVGYYASSTVRFKLMAPLTKKERQQLEKKLKDLLEEHLVYKPNVRNDKVCGRVVRYTASTRAASDD